MENDIVSQRKTHTSLTKIHVKFLRLSYIQNFVEKLKESRDIRMRCQNIRFKYYCKINQLQVPQDAEIWIFTRR